jgi:hypothetical protein
LVVKFIVDIHEGTRSKSLSRSAYRHSIRNLLYSRYDHLKYKNENVCDCKFVFCFVWVWNEVSRSEGKTYAQGLRV